MMSHNDGEDWIYETFDQNTPPSEFGPFEQLVTLWRSKWVGDALPAWRDFDFTDFEGWYGRLIVGDIIPGGNGDMRFRLWGTTVSEWFQRDLTGKSMGEVEGDWFDPIEFELVTKVVEEGVIVCSKGSLDWEGRGHTKIAALDMPLADDGTTIDKILCGVCQIE